jgi:hypothetical protein
VDDLTDLTLPTSTRASVGDWFKLDIGSNTDSIALTSRSPQQAMTISLLNASGLAVLASESTVANGATTATLNLSGLAGFVPGSYMVRVTSTGVSRYDLKLAVSRFLGGVETEASPLLVGDLNLFQPYRNSVPLGVNESDPSGNRWFQFTMARPGEWGEGLGLRGLTGLTSGTTTAVNRFQVQLLDSKDKILKTLTTSLDDPSAVIDLAGLPVDTYRLRVSGLWVLEEIAGSHGGTNNVSVLVDSIKNWAIDSLKGKVIRNLTDGSSSVIFSNTATTITTQLVGGIENDWDVGDEYQIGYYAPRFANGSVFELFSSKGPVGRFDSSFASTTSANFATLRTERRDVLLGGLGDDVIIGGSGADWIFGGVDRVLLSGETDNDILSGGYDRQAEDLIVGGQGNDIFLLVPDYLPEENGVGKDNNNSDLFVGGNGNDQVYFVGGDGLSPNEIRDFVVLGYDRFLGRQKLSALVYDPRSRSDSSLPTFVAQDGKYVQQFAFFRSQGIERTVVDTRGGDDVIHANPGYLLNSETWGISAGDLAAGAEAFKQLFIIGGRGLDVLHGGASVDVIVGDEFGTDLSGNNWMAGYSNDDILLGASGNEYMYGDRMPASLPGIGAILDKTPDSAVPPSNTTGTVNAYDYFADFLGGGNPLTWAKLDGRAPFNSQAGVDIPGSINKEAKLSDAFALEGLSNNQRLGSVIKAGDINRDGEQDFLVTGTTGESYLMYGPVVQSSMFRASSAALNGSNVVNVRGEGRSFSQTFSTDSEGIALFEALAPSVRASGRATVIFDPALGKVVGSGQILGDSASDVV